MALSIAERLRQKISNMEDRIYAKSAQLQSKILTKRVSYKDQLGVPQMNKKSSWIRSYAWDSHTSTLYMTTHRGKTYSWPNIDFDTAEKVKAGLAICTTNDPTGQNRWFIGKDRSLGAAFWQILKPLTRTQVIAPPVIQPNQFTQVFRGKGAPTKEERNFNRFRQFNDPFKAMQKGLKKPNPYGGK